MIFLTACKDNAKNLDMQAERQETTFRFRFSPFPWLIRSCAQEHCESSLPPAVSPSLPGMSDSASPRMEGEPPQVRSGTGRKRSHAVRRAPALVAVTFLVLQDGGVSHLFATFAIRTII